MLVTEAGGRGFSSPRFGLRDHERALSLIRRGL
jgi:hypothetical protein